MNLSNKQEKILKPLFFMVILILAIMPNIAFGAANDTFSLSDGPIKLALDLGLFVLAVWKWFEWINSFTPAEAFKNAITPGFFTFMAFYWSEIITAVTAQN